MKKVLIVEDEILARLGLRQLVDWKKLDLELLPDATDGEEALEMIRNSLSPTAVCRRIPQGTHHIRASIRCFLNLS